MNIEERLAAAERSARRGRSLAVAGFVMGALGLASGFSGSWTAHAADTPAAIRTRALFLVGDHGDEVVFKLVDADTAGAVELTVQGGKPGDATAGLAALSFTEHSTSFTVKPLGYGPPPQSWAQLRASDGHSTVTAYSGWTSAELAAHHANLGRAALALTSRESAESNLKSSALTVGTTLETSSGDVKLSSKQGANSVTLLERKLKR